jgi:sugar (pentulose or hexulose) kinase
LANTSELGGIYTLNLPSYSEHFVNVALNEGFVQYGSTNTGGNIINWFFENILKIPANQENIGELTELAASVKPDECPIFLPYIEGERAPFWNNQLSASFIGIKSFHTQAHLFRSLLESVAFARRQLFEAMGNSNFRVIKMGGGSTQNSLWNEIRASVLNKPILISNEKELAIIGLIDQAIYKLSIGFQLEKPLVGYKKVEPNSDLVNTYNDKYSKFLKHQKQLNITYE